MAGDASRRDANRHAGGWRQHLARARRGWFAGGPPNYNGVWATTTTFASWADWRTRFLDFSPPFL